MRGLGVVLAAMAGVLVSCEAADWSAAPLGASSYGSEGRMLDAPTGPGLVAGPRRWIPDVAMPVGFEPVAWRCHNLTLMHGGREVAHCYEGRAARADVLAFYRHELPLDGWRAHDHIARAADDQLVFSKGVETLRLSIVTWDSRAHVWVRIDQSRPTESMSLVP